MFENSVVFFEDTFLPKEIHLHSGNSASFITILISGKLAHLSGRLAYGYISAESDGLTRDTDFDFTDMYFYVSKSYIKRECCKSRTIMETYS